MKPNRRTVLKHGAAFALTALPGATVLAQAPKIEPKAKLQIPPILLKVVTRPNVNALAANDPDLEAYRTAIKAMKALPTSDPRSWHKQAEIHNNNCPHRNWFFLPWHRAYLVAFERICRQLSGKSDFALPYWDWTGHPQLPAVFAAQNYNGQPNPLFDNTRASQTATISSTWAGPNVISQIDNEPTFEAFASTKPASNAGTQPWRNAATEGLLESSPHDHVHTTINGDMGGFLSPLDPIFWLHHCNIDRIWDRWNRNGNANTTDTSWLNMTFTNHFVNTAGNPYTTKVSNNLNITALGYKYPTTLRLPPRYLALAINLSLIPPVEKIVPGPLRIRQPVTAAVKLNAQQIQRVDRVRALKLAPLVNVAPGAVPAPPPARATSRVIAFIRDVEPPKSGNADVRVFVNAANVTAQTPTSDPHYAGSFTFFGAGDHGAHPGHVGGTHSYMIDLTPTLIALKDQPKDRIDVQLIAVPIPGVSSEGFEAKAGSIDVAIF
jgi:tyrosinase